VYASIDKATLSGHYLLDPSLESNNQYNKCTDCFESFSPLQRLCRVDCSRHLMHAECYVRFIKNKKFLGLKPTCRICVDLKKVEDVVDSAATSFVARVVN